MQLTLFGASPKTFLDSSVPETMRSASFWQAWWAQMPHSFQHADNAGRTQVWLLDPAEPLPGGFSMLNGSASPNAADVSLSSLSEVLETGEHLRRYCLSPTACRGILRRAATRGKALPPALHKALTAMAEADMPGDDAKMT